MGQVFDNGWKIKCVELALTELIELKGVVEWEDLFVKAKEYYNKGYEYGINDWSTFWEKDEVPEKVKKKKVIVEEVSSDGVSKVCPGCGELIPLGWKEHKFRRNGDKCGYKYK